MRKFIFTIFTLTLTIHFLAAQASISVIKKINGFNADIPEELLVLSGPNSAGLQLEYTITNTGTIPLEDIVVSDTDLGTVISYPALAPGASEIYSTILQPESGTHFSEASVTGQPMDGNGDPTGSPVSDTDPGIYTGVHLSVEISVSPSAVCLGGSATITAKAKMTGGQTGAMLQDVSLNSNRLPQIPLLPYSQYWAGGDLNGNGVIDFIDNDGDGNSDEIFTWVFSATNFQTGECNLSGQTMVWNNNTIIGYSSAADTETIQINLPPPVFGNIQNTECGNANGSIELFTGGGNNYLWSNGLTSQNIYGLSGGTYTVTVINSSGCTTTASFTVQQTGSPTVTGLVTTATCNLPNGSIDLSVTGGTLPFNYDWAHTAGISGPPNISSLSAGVYTVTVTDALGCKSTSSFVVSQTGLPTIIGQVNNVTCNSSNGSIAVIVFGGVASYTYDWNYIPGSSNPVNAVSLSAGDYTITVTDNTGCSQSANFTIGSDSLNILSLVTPNKCYGDSIGSISVTPANGIAPFSAQWDNLNGYTGFSPGQLKSGTYCVTMTDAEGCSNKKCITLTDPPQMVASSFNCDNTVQLNTYFGTPPYSYLWNNGHTSDSGIFQPGNYSVTVTDNNNCTTYSEFYVDPAPVACTFISGVVHADKNNNCTIDPNENGFGNWVMVAQSATKTYYGFTDSTGHYTIRVEQPDEYLVGISTQLPANALICGSPMQTVNVSAIGSTGSANFIVTNFMPCPTLAVDLSTTILRRCSNNNYTLNWCNNTAFPINDAYIDISLDEHLSIISSLAQYTPIGNHIWRFPIGNVAPNQCGTFIFRVYADCSLVLGETLCATATGYPNDDCIPAPSWGGAEIDIHAVCETDSLRFIIKNIGSGQMTENLHYIVIEDGIMTMMQDRNPLAAEDSLIITVPANGSTWRLEANQEPHFPGLRQPVLSVEGCSSTGQFSMGWLNQFPVAAQDPWQSTWCEEVVGSFDPNDKQGFPLGYGAEHWIDPKSTIHYRIRFQNTGTDTAFAVVIRDTLSPWLNPASFHPGTSSHAYQYHYSGENVIVFDFKNIIVPDSNVNQSGSQGFVEFSISTRDSTPLLKDILNNAAIYFDRNEPVFTNTTQHRTGQQFLTVGVWPPISYLYNLEILPNPMQEICNISIPKLMHQAGKYQLQIYNLKGKKVQEMQNGFPLFSIQKGELTAGIYPFQIILGGQSLVIGKIIITQ